MIGGTNWGCACPEGFTASSFTPTAEHMNSPDDVMWDEIYVCWKQ